MGLAMLAAARWLLRAPSATEATPAAAADRDGGTAGPETGGDGE